MAIHSRYLNYYFSLWSFHIPYSIILRWCLIHCLTRLSNSSHTRIYWSIFSLHLLSFHSISLFFLYHLGNMLQGLFMLWIHLFLLFMKLIHEPFKTTSLPRFVRFSFHLLWIQLSLHLILYKQQILVLI